MNTRIKSTLSAALIALSFISTGALFGSAPTNFNKPTAMIVYQADGSVELVKLVSAKPVARNTGLQRHIEMPFFSFSRTLK
jgi:hypothetical protein